MISLRTVLLTALLLVATLMSSVITTQAQFIPGISGAKETQSDPAAPTIPAMKR